ncbi:mitochondrial respiratory chain complex III assembly protein, LYR family Mzm1 [Schizosaccharomyces osmophilus]|uniref:Mitochondrial zinc maintenance protein 1, mitochondrial n=1 Tax=Schizosaccharomyces osmophilus TaxID=2545709 RepID=A0AAE9WB45_9SCHI|nr:mitochondrial respiratory chain complex III assembly protein, LYR family Mzm1 [Schizosaccharomyces osmophilus]WBW72989.1 mitochondrial respiratory chain complex III assembly protein, LYR family Mzm1 [Schizosaccharomyces osmophilus]
MAAARSCFRNLWRASKEVFEGDAVILEDARTRIRSGFRESAGLAGDQAKEKIELGNGVASILRNNVVQAVKKDDGVYSLKIRDSTEMNENKHRTKTLKY